MDTTWEKTNRLRAQVRERLAQSSETLIRFAAQLKDGRGIPLNTWRRLDRPLGREATSLGSAFDVWHAMLRAERTLRTSRSKDAEKLRDAAMALRDHLKELTDEPWKFPPQVGTKKLKDSLHQAAVYAHRLTSDDVFGTFNGLTAASVLRSEIFPERSAATPSYLAGHIIVSELKIAREQAKASSAMAIRDRSPRLAVVAEGVHSLMLYVEHLRTRARLFRGLAEDMKRVNQLYEVASDDADARNAVGAYLRVLMTRMAVRSSECGTLLLATKAFFWSLSTQFAARVKDHSTLTLESLDRCIAEAVPELRLTNFKDQTDVARNVTTFCGDLRQAITEVHTGLNDLLTKESKDAADLHARLHRLRNALDHLEAIHAGGLEHGEAPSINDAARFQFARMIVNQFWDKRTNDFFPLSDSLTGTVPANIRFVYSTYLRDESGSPSNDVTNSTVAWKYVGPALLQLGQSSIGKSVLLWWKTHAECYAVDSSQSSDIDTACWIGLRDESFGTIKKFTESAKDTKGSDDLCCSLETAAVGMGVVANKVEAMVRTLTDWCAPRGHHLLQAQRPDPQELAAALWIADRIGEPWPPRLEAAAFDILSALQRSDGGFPATAPLFHNRGFIFLVPSASTISVLARFVTAGTAAPTSGRIQERLQRWKPILENGARFLVDGMVGQEWSHESKHLHSQGWHSDRHPEADRVDCHATTEAVTALCRLDDALRWLVNLEAMEGFRVSWPRAASDNALPTDCGAEFVPRMPGEERRLPQMLTISRFVHRQRNHDSLYTTNFETLGPDATQHVFMLYGPPGTGKTHFQSLAAGELRWPVLTLTIGDFLNEGEDRVGKRADDIFRRLHFLSNVGIVFDEFDEMVAERDTSSGNPRAGFPMLTAAMLPLLAELREHARREGCLVSFTTNFIESIDQAAKRVGRIDKKVLVVYPDYYFRLLYGMLRTVELKKTSEAGILGLLKRASIRTGLCAFPDVVEYIDYVIKGSKPEDPVLAITVDYYEKLVGRQAGTTSDEVVRSVKELQNSIGGPAINEWLELHKEWDELFRTTSLGK
jgi:hypothetical protein